MPSFKDIKWISCQLANDLFYMQWLQVVMFLMGFNMQADSSHAIFQLPAAGSTSTYSSPLHTLAQELSQDPSYLSFGQVVS